MSWLLQPLIDVSGFANISTDLKMLMAKLTLLRSCIQYKPLKLGIKTYKNVSTGKHKLPTL
jgi:hypothetical protein